MNVRRVDLTFIKQHINHKIRDPLNRIDLLKILSKADNKERLFFLKTIESKIIDDQQLMEIMLNDKIPQVRMILAKYLFKGFKHPKSFLDILLKDKSALVRYAALSNIPNNQFITYKEYFEPAIFDDYKAIREYARYILKTQGYSDYMEKYREKIIQCFSSLNTGIIVGLAEICEYQDINLISNFINHRNCKVRAAVLSAYYRVKLADQDYLYLNAIRDKSFKVRKIAIFILSQKNNREIKKALEILLYQENFKTKSAALEVLSSFNELESLQYILITLSLDDNNMANLAWQKLTSWYNHNQYQLWFNYDYAVYQNIMKLIEKIKIKNVKIPDFASKLWKDLPDIMHIIAKG
jgi:hypothetical protein